LDLLEEIDANSKEMSKPTKNLSEADAKALNDILDKMRG
jgi:hypothetical protein